MDSWQAAKVTVTLASEMHLGHRPMGFVARTLPFVPAHIPFYALIPPVVRALGMREEFSSYERMEKCLSNCIRFTPFIIFEDKALFPYNEKNLDCIERRYLASKYGVAIDYGPRRARDNHLFEMEYIMARPRPETKTQAPEPTRLLGYCFWKKFTQNGLSLSAKNSSVALQRNGKEKDLKSLTQESQWGGERNKGFGRLAEVKFEVLGEKDKVFSDGSPGLANNRPFLTWPAGEQAPFYLQYEKNLAERIEGRLMPLVGRRHAKNGGSGRSMDEAMVVWDLGWQWDGENGQTLALDLDNIRAVKGEIQGKRP